MSKNLIILVVLLLASTSVFAQGVDTAWIRTYSGYGCGYDCAYATVIDGSGNVYVTGLSEGSGTKEDYATIKYYPNGDTAWVRRYNGPGNGYDKAYAIAIDGSGNVYVTGESDPTGEYVYWDYATIKYAPNGNELWVRRYNGPLNFDDYARAITVDGSGNVYVTGISSGIGTSWDYATIKYDTNGNLIWIKRYNGQGNAPDRAEAIAVDGFGNVYVTGASGYSVMDPHDNYDYTTVKYASNGNELWVKRYNGPHNSDDLAKAMTIDGSGNVYVTGTSGTIKYNTYGDQLWIASLSGEAIVVDRFGNVYVTGSGGTIKYDGEGSRLWSVPLGGVSIAIDGNGNIYVTGGSGTIKYDADGNQVWVHAWGGEAITIDGSSNIFVTGTCNRYLTCDDYFTMKLVQLAPATIRLVYSRDLNGNNKRVFRTIEQYEVVIVFQNSNDVPIEVKGSDIQITWKGENTAIQGSLIPEGTYTVPAKGTRYVSVVLWSWFPGRWESTNFTFVGDKVNIDVKYKYDSKSKEWSVYVDEWGVPEWLNTGTTMHIEEFLHGPISIPYGNEHTNQMWLDVINGQAKSGGKDYGAILDNCRKAGVDAVSIGAEFYNYGRLEGGDLNFPYNLLSLFPLKMWAPTGPGNNYRFTTPPENVDPNKTVGMSTICDFISTAHNNKDTLRVIGYIETVGIYSPSLRGSLFDVNAYGHPHATELGWARYGYWRRTLVEPFYKHNSNEPPAPEPLVLGKDDPKSYLGDNPLDYQLTPGYSYADVAMATCFNGKAKGGELANNDVAFSVNALNKDSDPWENDPSFHYHMCRQISQLMDRGFDGFFFDNPGRIIETESKVQSIVDYAFGDDREKPIQILAGETDPKNSFFGLCLCPNCEELRDNHDENLFAKNSVANFLKHLRGIIKTKNWQDGALLSSNYYVPWESIVASEDLSSGDKIPIGSKSFALWAYLTYIKSFKPIQVDLCRVPTQDGTSDADWDFLNEDRFNETSLCHIAVAWANRVGMRLNYKKILDSGKWPQVSKYISFFKQYSSGENNLLRDPCMEMKFHSFLDFFNAPENPDPQVTEFRFIPPTKYRPYVVLYSIPDTTGEKYRVLWVINDSDPGNPHAFEAVVKLPPGTKLKQVELLSPDVESTSGQKQIVPKAVSTNSNFWFYSNSTGEVTQNAQTGGYVHLYVRNIEIWSVVAAELEVDSTWSNGEYYWEEPFVPKKYYLSQNYPNPFNSETIVKYDLPKSSKVKLVIYNILGQEVRLLLDEYQSAGEKTVRWNGSNDKGEEVASGVYFYVLKAGEYTSSQKMVLLK